MDIFQILKKDHQTVKELFKKLEATGPRATKSREKLFLQLKADLEAHTHGEEAVFYAALKEQPGMKGMMKEAMEEHKTVATLLEELEDMDKASEEWSSKLTEMKKNVLHHVKEEEGDIFKKARNMFEKEELETLGQEFQSAKKEVLS